MYYDITGCVILTSNNVKYLENEESSKMFAKVLYCHFNLSMQRNQRNVGKNFVS